MAPRYLDGKGNGEFKYDFSNDILLLKIKGRDYKKSIELENLVVDFDTEDFIYGLRIFDASKVLEIPKTALRDIKKFEFKTLVENNIIHIKFGFIAVTRNKEIDRKQDIIREAESEINNSEVICSVA